MLHRRWSILIASLAALAVPFCARSIDESTVTTEARRAGAPSAVVSSEPALPPPPFALSRPPSPTDARAARLAPEEAFALAEERAREHKDEPARAFAEASIAHGGRGQALLARLALRRHDVDAALYWIQRSALEEGIDPELVARDPDFGAVRDDGRYGALAAFLARAVEVWSHRNVPKDIWPSSRAEGPLLVVVHENGDTPADFLRSSGLARRAELFGVAVAGVSGTVALGPKTFGWLDDPVLNAQRIAEVVESAQSRTRRPARVILFGAGEGAQVALETAARDPERYAGAIALSPSGVTSHLRDVRPTEGHLLQAFLLTHGSFEPWRIGPAAYDDYYVLRALGADVDLHTAWLSRFHDYPPDYEIRLPGWVSSMRRAARKP